MTEKLRVLIIDDSFHNRKVISDILEEHPEIEVVNTAPDGEQGLKLVSTLKPDLITLDLEMPRMDGFTFLRVLMSQMPTPVIVVSSHSRKQEVFQALELGALDFVAKPSRFFAAEGSPLRNELVDKALAVRSLRVVSLQQRAKAKAETAGHLPPPAKPLPPDVTPELRKLVCIGASTGGPPALQSLFKMVNAAPYTAFLIAQHMPAKFTAAFAARLDRIAALQIIEAKDNELITPGVAYIAPGGRHLEVVGSPEGPRTSVLEARPQDKYVPSIDRMFTTAARTVGPKALGVVMTGMGFDGADGIAYIRARGGYTAAESSETAIVYGMPKGAIDTGAVEEILPLDDLIAYIRNYAVGNGE